MLARALFDVTSGGVFWMVAVGTVRWTMRSARPWSSPTAWAGLGRLALVQLSNDRLGRRRAVNIAADDPVGVVFPSAHNLGDDALLKVSNIKPRCRLAAPMLAVLARINELPKPENVSRKNRCKTACDEGQDMTDNSLKLTNQGHQRGAMRNAPSRRITSPLR
jgi:hypothetical protein